MAAYQAARAAALAVAAATVLAGTPTATRAAEMQCRQKVEQAWTKAGIDPNSVTETMVVSRRHAKEGNMAGDFEVRTPLPSCSGTLIVHLSDLCAVRQVYTIGDCSLPGVPAFP